MKGIGTIIRKEFVRVFKDPKLIFSLFLLPALIVLGMFALMGYMVQNLSNDVEAHVSSVYIQNAPEGLTTFIDGGFGENSEITYLSDSDETESIEQGILDGSIDLLVTFPTDFLEAIRSYKAEGDEIPSIVLNYNTTGNYSTVAKSNFESMVLAPLQSSLLAERFGNLDLLTVYEVKDNVIVNEDKANGEMMAQLLPYFITFMLFAGAMSLGVDAITGEKERGTMAKLLLTPLKRSQLVCGKLIALSVLSGISALVYAVAMVIALPLMGKTLGEDALPFAVKFSPVQVLELVAIMLVMVYLYVALVALVSVLAKTSKEAQTYVSPLYIAVVAGGMITMFQGGMEKPLYQFFIPVYGNSIAIQNLMTNELTAAQFGASICGTGALAIIITALIAKAFNSEKVMFNA